MNDFWRSQFRHFLALHAAWRERLTGLGRGLVLTLVFAVPGLVASDSALAIYVAAGLMLLLVSWLVNGYYRPRLRAATILPGVAQTGAPIELAIDVENPGRRPVFQGQIDACRQSKIWQIDSAPWTFSGWAAGQTQRVVLRLTPRRRGIYGLPPLEASSSFPFDLFWRIQRIELRGEVLVLPAFRRLSPQELVAMPLSGLRQVQEVAGIQGQVGEYLGSREYQPGLPVRRWDYASWARLGRPVVREFSNASRQRVAVIVDPCVKASAVAEDGVADSFEARLSMAASLCEAIERQGAVIECLRMGANDGGTNRPLAREEWLACLARAQFELRASKWQDLELAPGGRADVIVWVTDAENRLVSDWLETPAGDATRCFAVVIETPARDAVAAISEWPWRLLSPRVGLEAMPS